MMKYFITASLVILTVIAASAQTKLALKLTSSIITQRISQTNDSVTVGSGSNAFVPAVSLTADMPLSENYFFSTGIGYLSKRINLTVSESDINAAQSKSYNVQYVQIPATIKLYTNEVALDKKLYFQFGPLFEINVHTKENDNNFQILEKMQPLDISLLFAGGVQIQLGPNTALQVGINYTRGLMNVVSESNIPNDNLVIKNDLYGIDLAVKF